MAATMKRVSLDENKDVSASVLLDSNERYPVILQPYYEGNDEIRLTEEQAQRLFFLLADRYSVKSAADELEVV